MIKYMNPIRIKLNLSPYFIYLENYEEDFKYINKSIIDHFKKKVIPFSYCFEYKKRKNLQSKSYLYRPFIVINTMNVDHILDDLYDFKMEICNQIITMDNFIITQIKPQTKGYLIFNNKEMEQKFDKIIKTNIRYVLFEKLRRKLLDFYTHIYRGKLKNDSLLFDITKKGNNFIINLWGSKKMLLLFNTLGIIDDNFESIAFFYPLTKEKLNPK